MKLPELRQMCIDLGLSPIPTRHRLNPDRYELSMDDCTKAIQQYYLEQRKLNGTYDPSIEFMLSMKSPMLALLIKNQDETIQKEIWDNNNPKWEFQCKVDGCHDKNTRIVLSDGSTKTIKEIVDNHLDVLVKSYNTKTGEVEPKRVINWFNNGVKNNVIKISNSYSKKTISVTDNHKYFTPNGYKEIKDCEEIYTLNYYPDSCFEALMGSVLGDTCISRDDRTKATSVRLRTSCKVSQEDYLDYKASIIGKDLIREKYDFVSGLGFHQKGIVSKDHFRWADLYDLKYTLFMNNPYAYFEKMGIIGLAFLFMDDGSNSGGQLNFHVNSWNTEQVEALHQYLLDLNIKNTIKYEESCLSGQCKKYPMIHLTQIPARKFSALISNYVHPVMRYKLHPEFINDTFIDISKEPSKNHITKVNINILKDKNDNISYSSDTMYDIEVEDNHNYFVCNQKNYTEAFLVHNCRIVLSYDAGRKQFHFYSRNLSQVDLLPIDYSDKIVIPQLNQNIMNNLQSFVLDCEVVPKNGDVTDERVLADSQLNVVSSILQYLPEESHHIQETNPLKFITFDCLMFNNELLIDKQYVERKEYLQKLEKLLELAGFPIEMISTKPDNMSKEEFYNSIVDNNGEGVVAHNIYAPYDMLGKRDGAWTKIKRSVSETLSRLGNDTIDAFVSGFTRGTLGTKNENKVGALVFSVYLTDDNNQILYDANGLPVIHEIAQISGITDELRDLLSVYDDSTDTVTLNPHFYNQVAEIDGQDISSQTMRLAHSVFVRWRPDRSYNTCLMKKSFLESQIL